MTTPLILLAALLTGCTTEYESVQCVRWEQAMCQSWERQGSTYKHGARRFQCEKCVEWGEPKKRTVRKFP